MDATAELVFFGRKTTVPVFMKLRHRSFLTNRQLLGQIVQTGESNKTTPQARRVFDYYAIVLLLEGKGWFCDENHGKTPVETGDLFLLFPGVWHSYGPCKNEVWREIYLVFSGPVFDLWRKLGWLDERRPVFRNLTPGVWLHRLQTLLIHQDLNNAENGLLEICRLQNLLADLCRGREENGQLRPGDRDWSRSVKAELQGKEVFSPGACEIHIRLGMTSDAFRKRFRRVFGKTFHNYLNGLRIVEACRLLVETHLTSREICERLGYCDEFYFCRAFKKSTGHSPREYRRILKW